MFAPHWFTPRRFFQDMHRRLGCRGVGDWRGTSNHEDKFRRPVEITDNGELMVDIVSTPFLADLQVIIPFLPILR